MKKRIRLGLGETTVRKMSNPTCPFCESEDTEKHSEFGSEVSKQQYYCNGCNTVFERVKFDGDLPETGRED